MSVAVPNSVPHLALPFQLDPTGAFMTLQQDTEDEVRQSVAVLLGTRKNQRVVVPDYGVLDPTFTVPDPDAVTQAVAQWEQRAAVTVEIVLDTLGNAWTKVRVALANPTES